MELPLHLGTRQEGLLRVLRGFIAMNYGTSEILTSVYLYGELFIKKFATEGAEVHRGLLRLEVFQRLPRSLSRRKFLPLHVVLATGQPTYGLCPKSRFMFLRDTLLACGQRRQILKKGRDSNRRCAALSPVPPGPAPDEMRRHLHYFSRGAAEESCTSNLWR